jgi:hypothetical protein
MLCFTVDEAKLSCPSILRRTITSCTVILALALFCTTTALAQGTDQIYGALAAIGPSAEPCATEANVANPTIVTPTENWQQLLVEAKPGATILLHGGVYQAQEKLWLPAGAPDQFITIKPYNCEPVMLYANLRPLSYTRISGLTLEAKGINDSSFVIRIDSEYKGKYWGNITQVFIQNNIIRGGKIDAIRISDDSTHVTITGNHIDGGGTGHNIFVTSEKLLQRPDHIVITNNRLTKQLFATPAEDMFQVRDVGYVEFTYNTCTSGANMEQCVDIKTTTQPLVIAHNFFDGANLHQQGAGEDGADGCMVIHESDSTADQHRIEYNYFNRCRGAAIRFASGTQSGLTSSALVHHNVFYQPSYQEGEIPVVRAQNLHFLNNTVICGRFKLGNGNQSALPSGTVIKNNIFYKTEIEDNTTLPAHPYTCAYNLLYNTLDNGFSVSGCTNVINRDPQFIAAPVADFRLQPNSPALQAGENQVTVGALPLFQPSPPSSPQSPPNSTLQPRIYLPLIQQSSMNQEINCTP